MGNKVGCTRNRQKLTEDQKTALAKEFRLDRRNPFKAQTRGYGYFAAFLAGSGTTNVDKMVAKCVELSDRFGLGDNEAAIRADLMNRLGVWRIGALSDAGKKGLKIERVEGVKNTYKCVAVMGKTWEEYLSDKKR